jgi:hypothetical protein
VRNAICAAGEPAGEVQEPVFVANLRGQTSWYASPVIADLDGDGSNELIAMRHMSSSTSKGTAQRKSS